jgi:hypothetical protein
LGREIGSTRKILNHAFIMPQERKPSLDGGISRQLTIAKCGGFSPRTEIGNKNNRGRNDLNSVGKLATVVVLTTKPATSISGGSSLINKAY